jgi:flagellar biosynthesis chaperone FliJ
VKQIQEAIKAAKAAGMNTTIIVLSPNDGAEVVEAPEDPMEIAYAEGASRHRPYAETMEQLLSERDEARTEVENLRASMDAGATAHQMGNPAGAQAEIAALQETVQKVLGERNGARGEVERLTKALEEARASAGGPDTPALLERIKELEAAAAAPAAPAGEDPGAPLASFDAYPISVLGLEKKELKGCEKAGCQTVGEVREALLAGKLKEVKLPKDSVIIIANKLLGQAPSGKALAEAMPAASSAPAGHNDRPWEERIDAAFRKEKKAKEIRATFDQMMAQVKALEGQQSTPDTEAKLADLRAKATAQDKMLGMYEGQVCAVLWSLGLPHDLVKVRSVDGSLQAAGLVHLMRGTPAPETS